MKNLMKRKVLLVPFLLASMTVLSACGSSLGDATRMDKTLSIGSGKTISINMDGGDLSVGVSNDENVHITYYEYDRLTYDIVETASGISIEQNVEKGTSPNSIKEGVTILIPKNFLGSFVAVLDSSNTELDKLSAKNININSDNGDVKGSVKGAKADYTIKADVDMGVSNIPSGGNGEKILTVNVDLGDIEISFTE